jgi:hypothetical protein
VHQSLNRLLGEEARLQVIVRLAQKVAKRGGRTLRLGEQRRQPREQRPWRAAGRARMSVLDEIHVN